MCSKPNLSVSASIALLLAISYQTFAAEPLPLWEAGVGVGALSSPLYIGSDQRKNYAIPIPYLVYRGEHLQIERERMRGLFYKTEKSEFDISTGATLPAKSSDSTSRTGMSDLSPTLEIGPQWSYQISKHGDLTTIFRVPLRGVLAIDGKDTKFIGTVFTPALTIDLDRLPLTGGRGSISFGPVFGDSGYYNYFYKVNSDDVTSNRPEYTPRAGFGGWQLGTTFSKRIDNIWVGGFLRGNYINGATFENSPLVKQNFSLIGGLAISWIFLDSKSSAQD
jgi:outer membrane scaffolding protein for murein synthesis (MipA/OmpV family)